MSFVSTTFDDTSIRSLVQAYLVEFPGETERLRQLIALVEQTPDDAALCSSSNPVGHVTASAFVVHRETHKILRIHHARFQRPLQPGGHIRSSDRTPLSAAVREVREETGLRELEYCAYTYDPNIPIDIDTHLIHASKDHGEEDHFHHDFRYVFLTSERETAPEVRLGKPPPGALPNYQWDEIRSLRAQGETFEAISFKIEKLLRKEMGVRHFYDRLLDSIQPVPRAHAIMVVHVLPGLMESLQAIQRSTQSITLIPKPRSVDSGTMAAVRKAYEVMELARDEVAMGDALTRRLDSLGGRFVLHDIGGWFAPVANQLAERYGERVAGAIEDTENGHRRYLGMRDLALPVVSVARSPLKDNEDYLIGQSIVFSTDAILRDLGRLLQYCTCGVLGYGKIGRSISEHLLLRGVKPSVYDIDPIRRTSAFNRLCAVPSREDIIAESDVIFCATGGRALSVEDFRRLRSGSYVVSVTSGDDEFDMTYMLEEYSTSKVLEHVERIEGPANWFYLLNKGDAVNFIHKAVVGEFIHLVRGEMLVAHKELLTSKWTGGLRQLGQDSRALVARTWLHAVVDGP